MARLIDAEIKVKVQLFDDEHEEYITREMTVEEALDSYTEEGCPPTVDAEPVRHGKWIYNKWSNMRHDYNCSLCGCRITGVDPFSLSATAYYYCPECGAKMDEVEDGTTN